MKGYSTIFSIIFTFIFTVVSTISFAHTDLISIRKQVDSIIISVIGKDNFRNHVNFNKKRSTYYKRTGGMSSFERDQVDFNPDQLDLWYDLDLIEGNYLDDVIFVRIFINSKKTEILISGIPECISDTFYCDNIISLNKAKDIAKENGISIGLKEWNTQFAWKKLGVKYLRNDNIKIVLDKGYYYWSISNCLTINTPEPCLNGTGESIEIDAITGTASQKKEILISCYN
jgi:hypothetical protein